MQNFHKFSFILLLLNTVYSLNAQNITTNSAPTNIFDSLIIPGNRIGPVAYNAHVRDVVNNIGNPKKVERSNYKLTDGSNHSWVTYQYEIKRGKKKYSLNFNWDDSGLNPVVSGVATFSENWVTEKGIHVGSSLDELEKAYGEPDLIQDGTKDGGTLMLFYNIGILFMLKDRNSPIFSIALEKPQDWSQYRK